MKTLRHFLLAALLTTLALCAPPTHAAPGDLDPLDANLVGDHVLATAVQPDGKTILAGQFTSVLGVPRQYIARLNADGTLDMGFDPKPNSPVRSVAVQADGKVLLGGNFNTLQPNGAGAATARQYIARVHADGTLDPGFNPKASFEVYSVAVQADGKVLLGGAFFTLQPNGAGAATARSHIARVNADGTLDPGFDPNANSFVFSVAVQADGKVLLGGAFFTLQPNGAGAATARQSIARVNADGTLDMGFDPRANDGIYSVAVQADGKVLLGGNFNTLQPNGAGAATARQSIARVNADGTLDPGFDPRASASVNSVAVQADGKVLLGGNFNTLQPNGAGAATARQYIARVHADGTLDPGFNPKASFEVYSVAVQADGKVLLGGAFFTLQPNGAGAATARNLFARLENDPATQTLTAPDATQALWTRGGAGPELTRVTFEVSTDGGTTWGAPIAGTRIGATANWQATGLALPASGHLRARGATTAGFFNGSSGLIEQVASFTNTLNADYYTGNEVPLTTNGFTATGYNVSFTLHYAPAAGTTLMVLDNTGPDFIAGAFGNLAQGQTVALTYNGETYTFVANYYGSTGNDLVLQWANTRLLAWGKNAEGQLGNRGSVDSRVPVGIDMTGVLAGKTVLAVSAGRTHTLALCSDGTLAAWGNNTYGQLGTGNLAASSVPVAVDQTGVLATRRVVAVAAGEFHSLALCSDGRVAAWGWGEVLGDGINANSSVPVLVDANPGSVLNGKTVVAVAAGWSHSLALCSDGTVATWGSSPWGALGDGTNHYRVVPVAVVDSNGVFAGKKAIAVAAGVDYCVVLCRDNVSQQTTVVTWGRNAEGQLGNGGTGNGTYGGGNIYNDVPVAVVDTNGVFTGKTVVGVAAGFGHTLALCRDDSTQQTTVAAWGYNANGEVGDGTSSNRTVPVAGVDTNGVFTGKTVTALSAGLVHSLARCSDGSVAAWGSNAYGMVGNDSAAASLVPVAVNTTNLLPGERFVAATSGPTGTHNIAIVASGASTSPLLTTLGASAITSSSATLNGTVNANGNVTSVTFEFGETTAYGTEVGPLPSGVSGNVTTLVSGSVGLMPGTTYHYRLKGTTTAGTYYGNDMTFTALGGNADLSNLVLSAGTLDPAFASATTSYAATVGFVTTSLTVTPTVVDTGRATVTVNGFSVIDGTSSEAISLAVGSNVITIVVTAEDPGVTKTYTVTVEREAATLTFILNVANGEYPQVPLVTASSYTAVGTVNFILNYAPVVGTTFIVVNNTGLAFISGTFSNLAQGQIVPLTYNGVTYTFVANYYGGTGNDLVLQWANVRPMAWGANPAGQLGNNSTTDSSVPVPVDMAAGSALHGRIVIAMSAGKYHTLALCADGTLAAWGENAFGQLGDGTSQNSVRPVQVVMPGGLASKRVVAVAAGERHSLALFSDGKLAAWGYNGRGQLGDGSTTDRDLPVVVDDVNGVLVSGVVAVAAGGGHNLALCSDGTVAAWGWNASGQLGDQGTTDRHVPVAVSTGPGSAFVEESAIAVAAGEQHSVALRTDHLVAAWGANFVGQLGDSTTTDRELPVLVNTGPASALHGHTVNAVGAGLYHSLARRADGALAAWGYNLHGQLGNDETTDSPFPVLVVDTNGVFGGPLVALSAGVNHTLALISNGLVASWGANASGQLGNGETTDRFVPVNTVPLAAGEVFVAATSGSTADHTVALVAGPVAPEMNVTGNGIGIPDGSLMPNPDAHTDFGSILAGSGSIVRTFTIHNTGGLPLNLTGTPTVEVSGPDAPYFSVTAVPSSTVASGGSTTFQVTFTPSSGGGRIATISIANDDSDENPYYFVIRGVGQATYTMWRDEWGMSAGNSGPTEDYDGDGLANLLEYGLGLIPTNGGSLQLPGVGLSTFPGNEYMFIGFLQPPEVTGITYHAEWTPTLSPPDWLEVPDTGGNGYHFFLVPLGTETKGFMRLKVTSP